MTNIVTPVGRIVWGNPLNARPKTDNNNNPVVGQDGKPVQQWSFGLAINKQECAAIFQAMQQEAQVAFPNGAPANFAWKFKDGDGVDDKGLPFANREGYKGCIVLSISTEAFGPRVVRLVNGQYQQMMEGIKTGDYVRVALDIRGHQGKPGVRGSVPGLYINPQMVEFIGYGQEIINGPDAASLFGGQAVSLPPGASATPLAPAAPMPAGMPGATPQQSYGPAGMPGATPQQSYGPAGMPGGAPVAPAHDFVQNATGGAMPGGAPAAMPGGMPGAPFGAAPVGMPHGMSMPGNSAPIAGMSPSNTPMIPGMPR